MEIDRQKLLASVGRVLPGIAKKELFEQADKLVFSDGYLVSYNDEVSIFERLPEGEFISGAVDGRKLYDLLGKLKSEMVELEVEGDKLSVKASRTNVSFDLLPAALPIDEIDRSGDSRVLPKGFLAHLKLVAGSCGSDMTRPVLTCVNIRSTSIEAANGYRMTKLEFADTELPECLLPRFAAELVADYEGVVEASVGEGGEWMRFSTEGADTLIFARLATGNFPDLSKLWDVVGLPVTLPDLSEIVDRAGIFSKRQKSVDELVDVELRATEVEVRASCDGARFSETLRWRNKDGVEANFKINPDFLVEALKSGTSCVVGKDRIKFVGEDGNWRHVIALAV